MPVIIALALFYSDAIFTGKPGPQASWPTRSKFNHAVILMYDERRDTEKVAYTFDFWCAGVTAGRPDPYFEASCPGTSKYGTRRQKSTKARAGGRNVAWFDRDAHPAWVHEPKLGIGRIIYKSRVRYGVGYSDVLRYVQKMWSNVKFGGTTNCLRFADDVYDWAADIPREEAKQPAKQEAKQAPKAPKAPKKPKAQKKPKKTTKKPQKTPKLEKGPKGGTFYWKDGRKVYVKS